MDEYTLKLIKPHCRNCGKQKVTDNEGNTRYVNKIRGVLNAVADSSVEDLKHRLENAVVVHAEDDV
jgi:hypothetical protein